MGESSSSEPCTLSDSIHTRDPEKAHFSREKAHQGLPGAERRCQDRPKTGLRTGFSVVANVLKLG